MIQPTVRSIKQAISTYELQGGSANLFINDDGLQLISEEERLARIEFYADHSIGWVARPRHGENGFLRRGKFKKASNMNYGLLLSLKLERHLANLLAEAASRGEEIDEDDEVEERACCAKDIGVCLTDEEAEERLLDLLGLRACPLTDERDAMGKMTEAMGL